MLEGSPPTPRIFSACFIYILHAMAFGKLLRRVLVEWRPTTRRALAFRKRGGHPTRVVVGLAVAVTAASRIALGLAPRMDGALLGYYSSSPEREREREREGDITAAVTRFQLLPTTVITTS